MLIYGTRKRIRVTPVGSLSENAVLKAASDFTYCRFLGLDRARPAGYKTTLEVFA